MGNKKIKFFTNIWKKRDDLHDGGSELEVSLVHLGAFSHIDFQVIDFLSRDRKVNLDWIISIGSSFSLSSLLACFLACFLHGGDHLQRALGNCVTTEAAARDAFRNGRPLDTEPRARSPSGWQWRQRL